MQGLIPIDEWVMDYEVVYTLERLGNDSYRGEKPGGLTRENNNAEVRCFHEIHLK